VKTFILASASPARRRLLGSAGIEPQVIVSGVDESLVEATDPADLAGTLAEMKARAVASTVHGPLVLGCDSVLGFDGEILGKPDDAADATRRWKAMRGRTGVLYTGHCLIDTGTGNETSATVATKVHFADPSDEEIAAYVASGEPLEVAGAFTIDGLGGAFVAGIEGDHGNVVGLSLPTLRNLLAVLGVPIISLWSRGRMDA
jgi:septum formation protein